LSTFFSNPITPAQRQYEAIRSIIVDDLPIEVVAKKFSYSVNTLYSLMRDARSGKLELFPSRGLRGPKQRQTPDYICSLIIELNATRNFFPQKIVTFPPNFF